jgi:hypothetical protein
MTTPPEDLADRARALVEDLAALMTEYPTEDFDVTPVVLLTATVAGDQVGTVPLLPGQVEWLRGLVADEAVSCRNAHAHNGQCGHCGGTGAAANREGR